MRIPPDLVVGNAWLYMLEDNGKTEFMQSEFDDYSKKLNEKLLSDPNCKSKGRYVDVSLGDILDTAVCYRGIVELRLLPNQEWPSIVYLNPDVDDARNKLVRKLEVYVRSVTPSWLLDAMEEVWIER